MSVTPNNLEAPHSALEATPPGTLNAASVYIDASAYRAATATPGNSTADAHLSNLSVVDDKSCEKQPTGFWGKVEHAILNAGTIMAYGEAGMPVPEDLLPHACPAEKVPAPAAAQNGTEAPPVVPSGADGAVTPAAVQNPGEAHAAVAAAVKPPVEGPGAFQVDLYPAQSAEQPTINLGDLNARPAAPNTESNTDGKLQVRLGNVQLPGSAPGADSQPSGTAPTRSEAVQPAGTASSHGGDAHPATAQPQAGDKPGTASQHPGDAHTGAAPEAHSSKTPPESLSEIIHKNIGQKPQELEPGINPRLGCVRILSHALHEADPTFPETNNTAAFRKALKAHGYEEVTVKPGDPALAHTQAGDVLIGSRPDGMPSHVAVSMGDGTVFNNNSDAGRAQLDRIKQFDQGMHDKHGHWMKDGFSDVTVFRKIAPAPATLTTEAGDSTNRAGASGTTPNTVSFG